MRRRVAALALGILLQGCGVLPSTSSSNVTFRPTDYPTEPPVEQAPLQTPVETTLPQQQTARAPTPILPAPRPSATSKPAAGTNCASCRKLQSKSKRPVATWKPSRR